jgi:hypothetical protein
MKSIAWTLVGFLSGVAAASAAFAALPSFWRDASGEQQSSHTDEMRSDPIAQPQPINTDPLGELDVTARVAMLRWMAANPQYEFITHDDCGCHDYPTTICPEFEAERIRIQSDYPYASARDYNGDGHGDFAIMIALKGKEGPDRLLIFNGPFGDEIPTPAFSREGWQRNDHVRGAYVGVNESDNGYAIKPKGATYQLVYVGNPS